MAIGTVTSANAARLYSVNKAAEKKPEIAKSAFSKQADKVELSAENTEKADRAKLALAIATAPEIRIELVEELKAKIRSNDYPIEQKMDEAIRRMIRDDHFNSVA